MTLVFLRAFRAPAWVVEALILVFVWPFLTNFAVVYCRLFPPPPTWMMLIITVFIDGLICFLVIYVVLLLLSKRRSTGISPLPPLPPI
jgi:hypothetical protein